MKQPHDEIIKNWQARAQKLKRAYLDNSKPYEYSQKALRLYFTLALQIAIIWAHKRKQAAQSFVPGGLVAGRYNGEPEQITIRSQWQKVDGGEYVITAKKLPWPLKTN